MNQDAQTTLDLPQHFPGLVIRIRDGWQNVGQRRTTKERGRRYERREVCPRCFGAFTTKGIVRHIRACKKAF